MQIKNGVVFEGKLVSFPTTDRFHMHGFLIAPKKARTCIVSVHGMTGNFYGYLKSLEPIIKKVNGQGIGYFSINTRGHDYVSSLRSINRKRKRKRGGTRYERFDECVADISGALNALQKLGYKNFILMGHSTGCQKVTYYQYKKKDRRIRGIIILAPADDYNLDKKRFGRKFPIAARKCKALVRKRKGDTMADWIPLGFSAQRFLSVADPTKPEARTFNYDGQLREFSSVREPILAVFGSKEQFTVKPVKKCLEILAKKSRSRAYSMAIIKGADHSFNKHYEELGDTVARWTATL